MTPELRATIEELAGKGYSAYRIAKLLRDAGIPRPCSDARWTTRDVGRVLGRYD